MSCLISICPKSLYLLSLSKNVFLGYRIPGLWLFVFQHFIDASPLSSDFLVLGKSAFSVAVPLKATPFFLWVLVHSLLALGTCRAAETNVWFSFLSQWSDSWTKSCHCPCQSVQSLSIWPIVTSWTAAHQASLSITNSPSLLRLMTIKSLMPSNHLVLCCPFSCCLQSSPASGSFPVSQSFASGGQNIGDSASVLAVNIQVWFALGMTCWISWQSTGLSRVFSNSPVQKHQFFGVQPSSWGNSHIHTWLLEKP